MEKELRYVAVISRLESGKFQITFPDFEGIATVAESEEYIEKSAGSLLEIKIKELQSQNMEIPKASSMLAVQEKLLAGQFTTYITVSPRSFDFNAKDIGNFIKKQTDNLTETLKSEDAVLENNTKIARLGLGASVIYILGVLMPFVGIKAFFMELRFGFFTALFSGAGMLAYVPDARITMFFVRLIGFLLLFSGIFSFYSYFKKQIFYMFSSSVISTVLFLITLVFYFILKAKVGKTASGLGLSYGAFFLFISSLILGGIAYLLWKNYKEEIKK